MSILDKELRNKLNKEFNIDISVSKMMVFVKEHNQFKRTLGQAVQHYFNNTQELYEYILERTDIPLYPNQNKKILR